MYIGSSERDVSVVFAALGVDQYHDFPAQYSKCDPASLAVVLANIFVRDGEIVPDLKMRAMRRV
jgi:hypothetical protein